tara:strand:+ start:1629 stop:2360 length:732 start_codon:yes stop_codon:yes gene_type:complete
MTVALDITLSMQKALQDKLHVLSNNASNAGTVGFQSDSVIFSEFLGEGDEQGTYSYLDSIATVRDTKVGPLENTGNPFHVALQGRGYFAVQAPEGIRYTRSGAFTVSAEGILVDLKGSPVLSTDGGEINILPESENVSIAKDGTLSDQNGILAQLGVFDFTNEYDMKKVGDTQLQTDQAAIPLTLEANVVQGALEQANTNAVKNMSEMMDVSRLYSLNQRYIEETLKLESKKAELLVSTPPAA